MYRKFLSTSRFPNSKFKKKQKTKQSHGYAVSKNFYGTIMKWHFTSIVNKNTHVQFIVCVGLSQINTNWIELKSSRNQQISLSVRVCVCARSFQLLFFQPRKKFMVDFVCDGISVYFLVWNDVEYICNFKYIYKMKKSELMAFRQTRKSKLNSYFNVFARLVISLGSVISSYTMRTRNRST